ncbi:hypothetical protein KHC28_24255 [Ancylobacter sonchi]|uniref:hypothetical protein n=1 Tax=Ancylobacter TaxID=99 RepID=UPI001BD33231|nr:MULTISPECIES: hypothetical protein [Ancylobacter]MBS7536760.1 hypothetical protein [Ancylobacter sonchi]MCB4770497.1 hypothetical protein [Ancylobacter sp. Lp-2]
MKSLITLAVLVAFAGPALADSCVANADAKKLAGAARTSFLGKCERDAQTACDAQATTKKLAGAAKTSFTTKCVKDSVGAPPG